MPNVCPVANDNGGSPIGVGVEAAITAPELRLALVVVRVSVSAARAGLRRAVRRNGDGGYAEFGGFLSEEFADVADRGLGEALVELSFGGNALAGRGSGAAGRGIHVDVAQAFDGDHLGLGCQQDVADLTAHLLVAQLSVTACPFLIFGNSVSSSFAVTGLARDVSLVLPFSVATPCAAGVMDTMSRADGQVVLRAPVSGEDVLGFPDVQFFEGHRFRYGDLDVQAVAATVKRRARVVVLRRNQAYRAHVQPFQGLVGA